MGLFLRMALFYPFFSWLAAQGIQIYDPSTDMISISVADLENALLGVGGYIGTFLASRYGKNFLNWRT